MKKIIIPLLYVTLVVLICSIPVFADSPSVVMGTPTESAFYLVSSNTSDLWDDLDTPADINMSDLGDYYNMTVLDTISNETQTIFDMNASWLSTINATYNLWAYNASAPYDLFNYNMSIFDFPGWTNVAWQNDTNVFTQNQNMSLNNITDIDYTKFHGGGYMYDNGTSLILGHS